MIEFRRLFLVLASILLPSTFALVENAHAFDLNGAWASDRDNCSKVFIRKGERLTFGDDSEVFGTGFIVDGNQITGRFVRCRIKARKDDGPNVNLIAMCATDIMLQSVQLNVRQVDQDTLVRLFPGMAGMEVHYFRCPTP